jgi:hypothetical protein
VPDCTRIVVTLPRPFSSKSPQCAKLHHCVNRSLVVCVCFLDRCLSFFFWPLCCLSLFDLPILIIPSALDLMLSHHSV